MAAKAQQAVGLPLNTSGVLTMGLCAAEQTITPDFLKSCLKSPEMREVFSISDSTLRYWRSSQGLPFIKINNVAYHPWPLVQEWIKERSESSSNIKIQNVKPRRKSE